MLKNQTAIECLLLQSLVDTSDGSNIQVYSNIGFYQKAEYRLLVLWAVEIVELSISSHEQTQ